MSVSAQYMAERFPASVLEYITERRTEIAAIPALPIDGMQRNAGFVADAWVDDIARDLKGANIHRAYDESRIRDHAENYANLCSRMHSLASRESFAVYIGVTPPNGKRITTAGACARLDDALWWRRQLRKVWTRGSENAMRKAGAIRKGRAAYASDEAVKHRSNRQRRTREWLESRVMVNGEGEQLDLIGLHEKSLANPALRRGEFMCRMRGFEEIAQGVGHDALFLTLTAPSAFHAQLTKGGANPAHDRQTVRDAQQWLCTMWARARAKLKRLSILFYGFRVAEPHHDATPHWHMVLFVAKQHAETLWRVVRGFWLSDYRHELKTDAAIEARAKCITIDPNEGSATGYVAKYVSKNIDGAGAIGSAEDYETGQPVNDGIARVAAWASCHGIRQFQQIGGPPVGLWRELRRVRDPVELENIERARAAADAGNWHDFINALGGLDRAKTRVQSTREKYRRECVVTPETADKFPLVWMEKQAAKSTDRAGREVLASTRYGEPSADKVCGVVSLGLLGRWASVTTRKHRWRIQRKEGSGTTAGDQSRNDDARGLSSSDSPLGPVAITVRNPNLRQVDGHWICERSAAQKINWPVLNPDFDWIQTAPYKNPDTRGPPWVHQHRRF